MPEIKLDYEKIAWENEEYHRMQLGLPSQRPVYPPIEARLPQIFTASVLSDGEWLEKDMWAAMKKDPTLTTREYHRRLNATEQRHAALWFIRRKFTTGDANMVEIMVKELIYRWRAGPGAPPRPLIDRQIRSGDDNDD